MNPKSQRIAALLAEASLGASPWDPHYAAYFLAFNRQEFYEAHEVLEVLWLPRRGTALGKFYQGLIQLAGAFVHLQKSRLGPAAALLTLAYNNFATGPAVSEGMETADLMELCDFWRRHVETAGGDENAIAEHLVRHGWPQLPEPS